MSAMKFDGLKNVEDAYYRCVHQFDVLTARGISILFLIFYLRKELL